MSQPETSSSTLPENNTRVNTIRLSEQNIENLKDLIIDKIRNMFQNFDDEKKDNLITNLPNFLILIVNNGKTQSEIVDLLDPVLGESSGEFVFWFFENLVNLTHSITNENTIPKEQSSMESTTKLDITNSKKTVGYPEPGKVELNQNITVSEEQLKKFNNFHELDSLLFPKYFTTSQINSIKSSYDPVSELGSCCFVVDDGIESLDISELIEVSYSNPELKRGSELFADDNQVKKTKQ